jgi:hypothetical protein
VLQLGRCLGDVYRESLVDDPSDLLETSYGQAKRIGVGQPSSVRRQMRGFVLNRCMKLAK